MTPPTHKPRVLIGLTGLAGSGKDTVAQALTQQWTAAGHSWDVLPFAYTLKRMAIVYLEDHGVPNAEQWVTDPVLKNTVIPEIGVSPRHIMQTLGTEWGQQCIGRDSWIKLLGLRLNAALSRGVTHVAITDARFSVEADWVRAQGGKIWRIERPGVAPVREHVSEAGVAHVKADRVIHNTGTLEDLSKSVRYELAVLNYEQTGLAGHP